MLCSAPAHQVVRFASTTFVALAAMLVSGCGTTDAAFYIHSAERDKQGQAVKDAWSKVDLKSQLAVPRQNLSKTLAEQVATEEEIWSKRRSVVAAQMAGDWTVATFQSSAANRLQRVLGTVAAPDTSASAAERYRTEAATVKTETDNRDRLTARIALLGVTAPTCEIVASESQELAAYLDLKLKEFPADESDKAALLVGHVNAMKDGCQRLQTAQANKQRILRPNSAVPPSGELGKAFLDLQAEEVALEKDKTTAELAAVSLKAAQSDYDTAEKALATHPGDGTKKKKLKTR